jgi:hypothetical protein
VFVFRCGIRLLLWWLPPPRHLDPVRIVEQRLVIVSGSDRGDCEVFLRLPHGRSQKSSLMDCAWLVDPHLVLIVRHPLAGLACNAN